MESGGKFNTMGNMKIQSIPRLFLLIPFLAACAGPQTAPPPTAEPPPLPARSLLSRDSLLEGFEAAGPLDEAALARPEGAAAPLHTFEGRLELLGEAEGGGFKALAGADALAPEDGHLPEFDFAFIQMDDYLVPVQRGLIITTHPAWNIILEPGRAWSEAGDGGYSRASLPFTLAPKGGNSSYNGTLTFLFDEDSVSRVWYQITQETAAYTKADFWGLLEARYHPGQVPEAGQARADFRRELAGRFPTRPIEELAKVVPGLNPGAFGAGVPKSQLTWYGVVVDGVNYLGGCQTRYGRYPYCESQRAASFSTAKSLFPSLALMRLAQVYGPQVRGLYVKEYVPETADGQGDWEMVTFDQALDMATGNFDSGGNMVDEDGPKIAEFYGAQPYEKRIAAAFVWPSAAPAGTVWVYHTSDTFIVTRAMQAYLQAQAGAEADIFEMVVDEVYDPLGLSPGARTSMRTADDNWQGQAEGGYGLWWVPDDIAKLSTFLNNAGGAAGGRQVLHPGLLAAALQRDPADRGVSRGPDLAYNNAFWAQEYGQPEGYTCTFWVVQMLGVSGNVVALMPNGVSYYYFSDGRTFTWDAAVKEADKIRPFCP